MRASEGTFFKGCNQELVSREGESTIFIGNVASPSTPVKAPDTHDHPLDTVPVRSSMTCPVTAGTVVVQPTHAKSRITQVDAIDRTIPPWLPRPVMLATPRSHE